MLQLLVTTFFRLSIVLVDKLFEVFDFIFFVVLHDLVLDLLLVRVAEGKVVARAHLEDGLLLQVEEDVDQFFVCKRELCHHEQLLLEILLGLVKDLLLSLLLAREQQPHIDVFHLHAACLVADL